MDRESRLQQAIAHDDVAEVHNLIVEERGLLDRVSKHPFPNTPLHLAAAAGKTQVAMEMAILKPSFARKLNPEGYSPMHLALRNKHYHTVRALMTLDPKLIRVRGQSGITPLHFVAGEKGDNGQENVGLLELLAEFLCACKSSIEDLTSQCETAVHVAIKRGNTEAFKVLFGWLKRVYLTEILNWKDEDGNTVLHIAVIVAQPQIIELLIGHMKLSAKNFQNKTALDIFQENSSGHQDLAKKLRPATLKLSSLSQFLSRELTVYEKHVFIFGHKDESARNIILLVATLITTATYQAALSPPGGYWQDNSSSPTANLTVVTANSSRIAVDKPHQAGNIIMSGRKLYAFTAFNSLVFLASIITVCFSYFLTLIMEFPKSDGLAGAWITELCFCLLGVVLVVPSILWMKYYRLRRGIDATGRRVGNFLESKDGK